ncbi:hypothetical protein GIB67_016645 [Kingdonia uniflora]|uniref:Uncharacterized protein n=1 Tax=Kingdonia uniflora TaxID=39325 RepID=A0A7J7MZ19_9MAGN|nr:hypothetical protein GIB67_016645 [Kingdonia uniflora]
MQLPLRKLVKQVLNFWDVALCQMNDNFYEMMRVVEGINVELRWERKFLIEWFDIVSFYSGKVIKKADTYHIQCNSDMPWLFDLCSTKRRDVPVATGHLKKRKEGSSSTREGEMDYDNLSEKSSFVPRSRRGGSGTIRSSVPESIPEVPWQSSKGEGKVTDEASTIQLCLPLSNLAKKIINIIGACPVQLNGNMWEVINVFQAKNLVDDCVAFYVGSRLMKGICFRMEEEQAELKKGKVVLEKKVTHLKIELAREGKRLNSVKAAREVEINELTIEARKNLKEVVIQRDRLGCHFLKMGYSKTEVNDIMEDTYIEELEVEDDGAGAVRGLNGVSPQTMRKNEGDNDVNPENERKDMYLRIKELENELAKEKDASVELESAHLSEEEARQYNQELAVEFD